MAVQIKEMAPRDGLQNIKKIISTEDKVRFIELLSDTGLNYIELTSFVSAQAIPQLADAKDVIEQSKAFVEKIQTSVLVPNLKGLDLAIESNMQEVAVFTAASESFNQKNINASIDESFARFIPVCKKALEHNMKVRAYISTAFVCPYQGKIAVGQVIPLIERLLDLGCYEVSIGDTIGQASPKQIKALLQETAKLGLNDYLAGHYHDTYGLALCNVYESLQHGISVFDTSMGGIGGCPYAPGSSGNLATEKLTYFCQQEHIDTGISPEKIQTVLAFIDTKIKNK